MARQIPEHDISPTLSAAEKWINTCLVDDGSLFSQTPLWTAPLLDEVYQAVVEHPDVGEDDFITKLKRQMAKTSAAAQQLVAEMLWALWLFPSNAIPRTKRRRVQEMWSMSGQHLPDDHALMRDDVLKGIGSGGPAFQFAIWRELRFLIALTSIN